ncbi:unnamed protein product [Dibothriocephalus latus]|uniref:Cadherin domain-containing protein n=1 Tax=Dibothriocephalus latus TaxID=60516 RepID=A0A3P6PJZ7_DIBLA|nr:unnamed protein product [Dibothriocephalus latus]
MLFIVIIPVQDDHTIVSYRISSGNTAGYFQMEPSTGQLLVSESLATSTNPEERQFQLQIEATDRNAVHITLHNVSVFLRSPSTKRLVIEPENGLNISLVEHFNSSTPHYLGYLYVRNAPPTETYYFEVLNPVPGLTIEPATGALFATGEGQLDREKEGQNITLRVLARERSSNSVGIGLVRLFLEDINDHDPVFHGQPYHAIFCVREKHNKQTTSLAAKTNAATVASPPTILLPRLIQACQTNFFKVNQGLIQLLEF